MCGINGIFAYHYAANPIERDELIRTRDHMAARGPDGEGVWMSDDRRIGLGHRRLSILDLSIAGAQPMTSADGNYIVSFNGEIYNYPQLRKELEATGVGLRTRCDTEILLHLYAREGDGMVHRLRGMFAFAIWDNVRRGLFLARDPYGIKPLYTADDGWTFRFASQVKALLAGGAVSRDPEPAGVVGFHLFGNVPEPFTLYREIRSLPAGHSQWVDAGAPREPKPFANLAAILAEGTREAAPVSELAPRVRAAALESVRAHLLADVEVGVFLSAGIDSSAILGLMRDAGHSDTRAITLAFDEFRGTVEDEAPLAADVARRYGARHVVRRVSEREFAEDLPKIFAAMDQPSIDGVNTWFIAKAAREAALKVAISGLGGDEILGGYPSFVDVPRWHRRFGPFARIPGLGRLARSLIATVARSHVRNRPKTLGMLEYAGTWSGVYLLRRGLFLPHELDQIMDGDLAREGMRRLKPLHRVAGALSPDPGTDSARVCALESSQYLRNQLLRDADWAGMAHSLEIRVPFVDVTLLRALAPVIGGLRWRVGKAALANAPVEPLPTEVVNRPKTGFGVPTVSWLNKTVARAEYGSEEQLPKTQGLASREWARIALAGSPIQPHSRELRAAS